MVAQHRLEEGIDYFAPATRDGMLPGSGNPGRKKIPSEFSRASRLSPGLPGECREVLASSLAPLAVLLGLLGKGGGHLAPRARRLPCEGPWWRSTGSKSVQVVGKRPEATRSTRKMQMRGTVVTLRPSRGRRRTGARSRHTPQHGSLLVKALGKQAVDVAVVCSSHAHMCAGAPDNRGERVDDGDARNHQRHDDGGRQRFSSPREAKWCPAQSPA